MSEINKIIDNFFEEAAWTIMYDNRKCFADLKEKWVADLTLTNECPLISEIQEEYLKLLDDIDKLVYGKIDENNSYVSYYKGNELFQTDVNISDIIEKVKQSSNSGDMAESLKEEVRKRLLEKNGYRRIAQLYYYKKNHKWYEKEVEEAYREIVDSVIGKYDVATFAVVELTDEEIKDRTEKQVENVINETYINVYENKNLNREYVLPKEEFKKTCEDDIFNYIYSNTVKEYNKEGWYCFKKYAGIIKERIEKCQYYSLSTCFESYKSSISDCKILSTSSYERFFKRTITAMAGFSYAEIAEEFTFGNHFVLKTITEDLNDCIDYISKKFDRLKYLVPEGDVIIKNADGETEFEKVEITCITQLINSYTDLHVLCKLMEVYLQIIIARNKETSVKKILQYRMP